MLFLLAWLSWLLGAPPAQADELRWEGAVGPGHVVLLEVVHRLESGEEVLVARFQSRDDERRDTTGWRPDEDEAPGRVRLRVPELWLAPGDYLLRERVGERVEERPWQPQQVSPQMIAVQLPAGAVGVRAVRWTQGKGHDGWAFAPALGTAAFLPLGEGQWSSTAVAAPGSDLDLSRLGSEDVVAGGASVLSFRERPAPPHRQDRPRHGLFVALGLVPASLLLVGLGARGLWLARRTSGLALAVAAGTALGLAALVHVLPDVRTALLMSGESYTDPPNSAALLEATADSVLRLSDVSTRFQYPEGHSWLVVGPSWLAYLPALPVVWLLDGIAGHNFGVFFGIVALCAAGWGVARVAGAGPVSALAAGVGAVLAPSLWGELSTLSLDRMSLFTVPVFFVCLELAASRPGWRWPVAAGAALAAAFYGQVYYGVYLALACPLLVLSRLVGPQPLHRLGRMVLVGVVAGVLVLPWAWALRAGTSETVYAGAEQGFAEQLQAEGRSLWSPLSDDELADFIHAHDRRRGDNQSRPTETPKDLLLVAVTNSIQGSELAFPSSTLTGHGGYWVVVVLALLAAGRGRRGPALRFALDTLILMVLALGPILRTRGGGFGDLMPYYGFFALVPGMEQLKHPDRYVLLAACISTVPIALGIEGLLRALARGESPSARGPAGLALALVLTTVLTFPLVTVTLRGEEDSEGFISLDTRKWLRKQYLDFSFEPPLATRYPRSEALASLDPGPALFLPVRAPTPEAQYMPAIREGLSMVNEPPHGQTRGGGLEAWTEANALLNRAAWLAGTDRARRVLEPGSGEAARADLQAHGLRWVILAREALDGPELEPALLSWMDAHFARAAADERFVAWSVEAPR